MVVAMSLLSALRALAARAGGEDASVAASAINTLGLELLGKAGPAEANALLSPYSIQSALAMTYAGADGQTRTEMAKTLHYPDNDAALHGAFTALQRSLEEIARTTAERAARAKEWGGPSEPITLTVANRLFGQKGYQFRAPFLGLVKENYGAPLAELDFMRDPPAATKVINGWVEEQTRQRIRDLVPPKALNKATRLVLVNAIYLKAPWAEEFRAALTKPRPFHVKGGAGENVPTMFRQAHYGYLKQAGFTAVTLPYSGGEVQFLVLLPDDVNGLAALEAKLTPALLTQCAKPASRDVILEMPKFKMQPPLLMLGKELKALGMTTAFDMPTGSANFDRMAPRRPEDYLYISEVFHKTFLALDEKGTEAAAATAVAMMAGSAMIERPQPIRVSVDHPFLFAIQHRASGACLFLGRVTDPR
jgi:serpin B